MKIKFITPTQPSRIGDGGYKTFVGQAATLKPVTR